MILLYLSSKSFFIFYVWIILFLTLSQHYNFDALNFNFGPLWHVQVSRILWADVRNSASCITIIIIMYRSFDNITCHATPNSQLLRKIINYYLIGLNFKSQFNEFVERVFVGTGLAVSLILIRFGDFVGIYSHRVTHSKSWEIDKHIYIIWLN